MSRIHFHFHSLCNTFDTIRGFVATIILLSVYRAVVVNVRRSVSSNFPTVGENYYTVVVATCEKTDYNYV